MSSRNRKKKLSFKKISRLKSIFESLDWSCDRDEIELISRFEKFCKMLENFDDSQQSLILDLTERFLKIYSTDYELYLRKMICLIPSHIINQSDTIYFLPLKDPDPKKAVRSKSEDFVLYFLRGMDLGNFTIFENNEIIILDYYPNLPTKEVFNNSRNFLFLVDDYIGSGNRADKVLNHITGDLELDNNRIGVLSIVAQKQGIDKIKSFGIECFTEIERGRGISDYYDERESSQKLNVMTKIGKMIEAPEQLHHGFNNSEALVSMNRTPNNTFPVYYWASKSRNFVGPFNKW